MPETTVILGASDNPERYAHMAFQLLLKHGHTVIPIHPALKEIDDVPVAASLDFIQTAPDTLTLYVGAARLPNMAAEILRMRPSRVIFNPGTESPELQARLTQADIPWIEGCTLDMLRTGQYCPPALPAARNGGPPERRFPNNTRLRAVNQEPKVCIRSPGSVVLMFAVAGMSDCYGCFPGP